MFRGIGLLAAASGAALMVSTPGHAATASACAAHGSTVVSNTTGCAGFYAGNVFGEADAAIQQAAISSLGVNLGGNYSTLPAGTLSNNVVRFGQTLYGITVVGMHFGNIFDPNDVVSGGQGNDNNVSVFYRFNFGTTGASGITLNNTRGWSNARLFAVNAAPPVPEPGTWALLILGFGALGATMRNAGRRKLAAFA